MNKTISKTIILRHRLKNKYVGKMSEENKRNYMRQRSYCVKLLIKKSVFANLETKKYYWQQNLLANCKAFFLRQNS